MVNNNQRGSAAIIVTIVLIVAALAFATWYIWQSNKNDDASTNNEGQSNQQTDNNQEEEQKYLTIEEWDVKIPLQSEVQSAYYEFESQGAAEYARIYDADFDSLENSNGVSCGGDNKFQIFAMGRIAPESLDEIEIETERQDFETVTFTDEYLFSGVGAHQSLPICSMLNPESAGDVEYDQDILDIEQQKENALLEAYESLQPAN